MRYPKFLPDGGTIGFAAPSFGCNIEPYRTAFESALQQLRNRGYQTVLGPNCYAGEGIGISNTPQSCGEELTQCYCDEKSDVLISCGGGELMCEILDHVDFERIAAAKPKWFMGYSDNTNFTFLLPTLCDAAAIYGPCAGAFGMRPWHPAVEDALGLLTGKRLTVSGYDLWEKEKPGDEAAPTDPYRVAEPRVLHCVPAGDARFSGRLLGGCMDCLVNLLGTKYDRVAEFNRRYASDGVIWFLEACDLNVFSIRRAMWQMAHAGWFDTAKGFLIGRPLCFGQEMMGLDQYRAAAEPLAEFGVPVIMDVDLGHLPPMMPLISGGYADVRVTGNDITVEMKLS